MFSLDEFIRDAHDGKMTKVDEFYSYLKSFENIVIWGAGNIGVAIDKKLSELEIETSVFWDAKYQKIKEKNGKKVIETFTGGFNKNTTLVIFCIANVPVSPKLYQNLIELGWKHRIKGLDILEGVLCPFSRESQLDTRVCNKWDVCTVCSCERLSNIMQYKVAEERKIPQEEILAFDRIHFIINNFCNLKCTHCFMYMNSYPTGRKRNVSLDIMKRDIDMLFNAIDSFGVVNVFGGEPFLHPELDEIVSMILEKHNYGSMIINTNGLADMKEEKMQVMKDGRVRLAFSNYLNSISEQQKEQLKKNIDMAKGMGIIVGMQNELPTWNISSTLGKNEYTINELKVYKQRCGVKFLYVHNGKVFPCAMCLSINDLGVEDYKTDYVDISKCKNAKELRKKILEMVNREYYSSCAHCDQELGTVTIAGEQGFSERYTLPKKE